MNKNSVFVTQPSLPPLSEYVELLEKIWESGILTHNGPMVQELESQLAGKLNVENLSLVTNGTIALQMAIKALDIRGEIITTPFSWIATVSSIKWEGCTPIFCDIEEDTFNIDVSKIEELITENTVAIIPVHVFGAPCNVEEIDRIAKKYKLKVIYDAAHALGSTYNDESILNYGDISATSLHGTKLFNTAEGGACISANLENHKRLERIRFFGHDENKDIVEDGLNGKMTEIHAALGIANLKYFDDVLHDRKEKYELYRSKLENLEDVKFQNIKFGNSNFSYFPLVFKDEEMLLNVEKSLNEYGFFPRRYFYPSLNTLNEIVDYKHMPISESLSKRILCLPLYKSLKFDEVLMICNIIRRAI